MSTDEKHFQWCSCRNSASATLTGTDNVSSTRPVGWLQETCCLTGSKVYLLPGHKQPCIHSAAAGTATGDKNTGLWNLDRWYMTWYFRNIIRHKSNTIIQIYFWQSKPKHLQNTADSSCIKIHIQLSFPLCMREDMKRHQCVCILKESKFFLSTLTAVKSVIFPQSVFFSPRYLTWPIKPKRCSGDYDIRPAQFHRWQALWALFSSFGPGWKAPWDTSINWLALAIKLDLVWTRVCVFERMHVCLAEVYATRVF